MARQLDFSPLDFQQEILADPVGKAITGAIEGVGRSATKAIQDIEVKKQKREAQFVEDMKFDSAITGNSVTNDRLAREYGDVKSKWVNTFSEKKGKLSPEDKIRRLRAVRARCASFVTMIPPSPAPPRFFVG